MYHYLISLQGTVKLLVNENEMPENAPYYNLKTTGLSYALVIKNWISESKGYDFASGHENKFREECSCLKAAKLVELQKKSVYPFRS